jgi:hypothetical protein
LVRTLGRLQQAELRPESGGENSILDKGQDLLLNRAAA